MVSGCHVNASEPKKTREKKTRQKEFISQQVGSAHQHKNCNVIWKSSILYNKVVKLQDNKFRKLLFNHSYIARALTDQNNINIFLYQ